MYKPNNRLETGDFETAEVKKQESNSHSLIIKSMKIVIHWNNH